MILIRVDPKLDFRHYARCETQSKLGRRLVAAAALGTLAAKDMLASRRGAVQ